MRRKLGDSGSFLPRKSPQEPTLRSHSHSLFSGLGKHGRGWTSPGSQRERDGRGGGSGWGGWGPKYLKMLYQLLGLDFDDNVILHKSPLQHLLIGELKCGLALGSNRDVDGELFHISARGSGYVTRGNNRQAKGDMCILSI